ncbi:50S ribosomal protein L1 [Thermogladius sp. 4427co]|uniref:50S ribosomal protein L1 n=1 Tax=Thermogladius sp. 4427co TaxID=3450718 RepID=UPI003F78CDE2
MPLTKESLAQAVEKALAYKRGNFKESVELIIVLKDVNVKELGGKIRETVILPKGRGKDQSICVVADGEMAEKARASGALMVLTPSDLQGMSKKNAKKIADKCDWVLVKTDLMAIVGRTLGPALGPRGKAPVPVPPTADISAFISRYKNAIVARLKDQPQIMTAVGTVDMKPEDIAENALSVITAVEAKLPQGEANIGKIIVKTTMGAPIEVGG